MLNATAGMHGKLHSLCALTRSLPAPTAMDGRRCLGIVTTRALTNDVGGESIFLLTALCRCISGGSRSKRTPVRCPPPVLPLLPRRGGVSFRVSAPTVLFREKVDGVKLCLVVGRAITMALRYGNCTSEANLRVLRFNFSERHRKGNSGAVTHSHHLSSKWAWWVAIYLPLLAIRQLGY